MMLSLRVELKTSRLLNGCSNQLSYESLTTFLLQVVFVYICRTRLLRQFLLHYLALGLLWNIRCRNKSRHVFFSSFSPRSALHLTYFFDKDICGQNFEMDQKAYKNLLQPKLICMNFCHMNYLNNFNE